MATMIANTPWGGARGRAITTTAAATAEKSLIVFSNEGAGPIVRNENCFKLPAGYVRVPPAVSWISFDFYNPPGSYVRSECERRPYFIRATDTGLPLRL